MIIAIEGMDASGKATHAKRLAHELEGVCFSFPNYDSPTGQAILAHLKGEWSCMDGLDAEGRYSFANVDPLVFQCLQTCNRLELRHQITRAVQCGPVIFDRYYASGIVYGGLDGLDRAWIERVQAPLPEPDVWIFLDIPHEESVRRRPERRDRYENAPGFMEKVRVAYLRLFEEKRREQVDRRWHVVNGVGTIEEVHARILNLLFTRQVAASSPPR